MGYLIWEILLFLALAFVLGLLIGRWIWRKASAGTDILTQDLANARRALEDCQSNRTRLEREESAARGKLGEANTRIEELEAQLAASDSGPAEPDLSGDLAAAQTRISELEAALEAAQAAPAPEALGLVSGGVPDEAQAQLAAGPFLEKPIGDPDDLLLIKGVGPKLGGTLNELGVFHFFQIAGWSAEDVAKVDEKLTFKGRIERDNWIDQAKLLADGDHEAFTAKYGEMGENRK